MGTAFAFDIEGGPAVQEPIRGGGSQDVVVEDVAPVERTLVGDQHQASALITTKQPGRAGTGFADVVSSECTSQARACPVQKRGSWLPRAGPKNDLADSTREARINARSHAGKYRVSCIRYRKVTGTTKRRVLADDVGT